MKLDESIKTCCEQVAKRSLRHAKNINHELSEMEIFNCIMSALEETYSLIKDLSYEERLNNIINQEIERLEK